MLSTHSLSHTLSRGPFRPVSATGAVDVAGVAERHGQPTSHNPIPVAGARSARQVNRRVVLSLIRKYQPVSRADLSRYSRLRKSTVSAIVESLLAERWITMCGRGDLPRGRKPTYLRINCDRARILGVDIRPGETEIAVADLNLQLLDREFLPTGRHSRRFVELLCRRLRQIVSRHPQVTFEGIGIAVAGRVDPTTGRLVFAPSLGWSGLDLKRPVQAATALPVELENAANACALAETWERICSGVQNLAAITVSESIGVGMVLNAQLVRGSTGLAGEFGYLPVQGDGDDCRRLCWDACGSNKAAVRYFEEYEGKRTGRKPPGHLDFEDVVDLAQRGQRAACQAIDRMARSLAIGCAMLVTGLAPDTIVIVGDVTRLRERVGPVVDECIRERVPVGTKTRIDFADPKTEPRLRGAVTLILQKHFGLPEMASIHAPPFRRATRASRPVSGDCVTTASA